MSAVVAKPSGIITLLSDLGLEKPAVGVIKGAIYRRFREATVVDLTHEIDLEDVSAGSFWLDRGFRSFPEGTVHVAFVGGDEAKVHAPPLLAQALGHTFVGPNNGLLGIVLARARTPEVRVLEPQRLLEPKKPGPFELFGLASAAIASGGYWPSELGRKTTEWVPAPLERPVSESGRVAGQVVCIDRRGHLIVNVSDRHLENAGIAPPLVVEVGSTQIPLPSRPSDEEPVAWMNGFGLIEIGVRRGSAKEILGAQVGQSVLIRLSDTHSQ